MEGTNKLPISTTSLKRLTELSFQTNCCQFSDVMDLINCCPKLEVPHIYNYHSSYQTHCTCCWRDPISAPRCLSTNLKRVLYRGFRGLEDEMAMLKFIVNHGAVMKSVDIHYSACFRDLGKKFGLLDEITNLTRASPTCKISLT
ncbi:OLC1v1010409C1 [Oldenlandia corymbosa var. corymbosa]|uniref:OLC1v1010409C1 n=1 Tax=Oldenlandia corymbosa var. corymbosa TaxID=529605 RepID=A0AAV1DUN1_OLDCO|nr:OLC1v1010409C1 [Oldenlandia corymbosa var. corymbosa]